MRLVIWQDMQFDADDLPPFVVAAECVSHDEYFGRKPKAVPSSAPVAPSKSSGRRQRGTNRSDD